MRIGVHADALAHAVPGGTGAYVAALLETLLGEDGDDDYVLLVSSGVTVPAWARSAEIAPAGLPLRALYTAWNYAGRPRIGVPLDVVHATAAIVPPAPGTSLVATVHDFTVERFPETVPTPWRQLYRRGLRRALREAAIICANSEATRAEVLERSQVEPERVVVTPLAGSIGPDSPRDDSALARLGIDRPFILHVGTLEPRKNLVALVDAFARVAGELADHVVVLAGAEGWDRGAIRGAIAHQRLGHRVVVTGPVTAAELSALYAGAHVFALPSLYEGFGIPLVEAMSFGIPAVVAEVPALVEVADGAALVAGARDVDGLAGALTSLATDTELRARLGSAGRARAATFSWARTATATQGAYQLAADSRR